MKYRILVVEDNLLSCEPLCDWLEAEGYEVLSETDLRTAIATVEAKQPQAVLLDVQLGDEDGLSLAAWMRRKAKLQSIPIIAVTAQATATEQELILQAGCNTCVLKAVDFKLLNEQLERLLVRPGNFTAQ